MNNALNPYNNVLKFRLLKALPIAADCLQEHDLARLTEETGQDRALSFFEYFRDSRSTVAELMPEGCIKERQYAEMLIDFFIATANAIEETQPFRASKFLRIAVAIAMAECGDDKYMVH